MKLNAWCLQAALCSVLAEASFACRGINENEVE